MLDLDSRSDGGSSTRVRAVSASAGTLTPRLSSYRAYMGSLDGNLVIANPRDSLTVGQVVEFYFKQDTTGYHTIAWGNAYDGSDRFMPRQGAGQTSKATFVSNGDGTLTLVELDGIDTTAEQLIYNWGADPTGVASSWTAIQACIDYALTNSTALGSRSIFLNDGLYFVEKPLTMVGVDGISLRGSGRQTCTLRWGGPGSVVQGPMIFCGGDFGALPTTTALVGSGSAMVLDGSADYYIALNDNWNVTKTLIAGPAHACVELFAKITSTPHDGNLFSCAGFSVTAPTTLTRAFWNQASAGLSGGKWSWVAAMTVGGVEHYFTNDLDLNTTYHLAIDYDGSRVRTFANGVKLNDVAASGTLTSSIYEQCTLGALPKAWPDLTLYTSNATGTLDSPRLSTVSRYTANFTPPSTKLTWDSNTLALHLFDGEQAATGLTQFYVNQISQITTWSAVRRPTVGAGVGSGTGFCLRDIRLSGAGSQGTGLSVVATTSCTIERVYVDDFGHGVRIENNCFASHIKDIFITGDGGIGFLSGVASTAGSADNINVIGYRYQIVSTPGNSIRNPLMQPNANTMVSIFLTGSIDSAPTDQDFNGSIYDPLIDDESASTPYFAAIFATGISMLRIEGGMLDVSSGGNGSFPLVTDNCTRVILNTQVQGGVSTPSVVHAIRANVYPIEMDLPVRGKTVCPLTDDWALAPVQSSPPEITSGITAHAGGGQASAVLLTSEINIVGTCASAGNSVKLSKLFPGMRPRIVRNDGANACDMFPYSGDDAGAGVNTAVSIAAGTSKEFVPQSSTKWFSR